MNKFNHKQQQEQKSVKVESDKLLFATTKHLQTATAIRTTPTILTTTTTTTTKQP